MDSVFVVLALLGLALIVLGPAGFVMALASRRRLDLAEMRLTQAERRLRELGAAAGPRAESAPAPAPAPESVPEPVTATEPEPLRGAVPHSPPASVSAPPAGRPTTVEEVVGARWSVWVGGVALALGALLLVRLAVEQGFFGPGIRVLMGLALALGLVAGGEVMRRRRSAGDPSSEVGQADVPSVLTAAGTVAAFGAIYAAHALYGFVGPAVAFVALTAVGLGCMFASALHGPALAGLGLVGALAAPALVASSNSGPWPLVIHAAVVVGAAYALSRLRRWLWLAATAAVGAGLWSLALQGGMAGWQAPTFFAAAAVHGLVHLALAAGVFAWAPLSATAEADARPDPLSLCALAAFSALLLGSLLGGVSAGQFGPGWVVASSAGVAILAATGFLLAPVAGALAGAGLLALLALRIWPTQAAMGAASAEPYWAPAFDIARWSTPLDPQVFAAFGLLTAGAVALAAGWRLRIARDLPFATTAIYAASSVLAPLLTLALVFVRMTDRTTSYPFAALAAALAVAFTVAAAWFRDHEEAQSTPSIRLGTGAYASAAIAALALGLVFALDGGVLTVAFALAALGAAVVSVRLELPALRWCVAGLGLVTAARLAWEPRIVVTLGPTLIFNWLLFGYGVPAVAFAWGARAMRLAGGEDTPVRVAQSLSMLFGALLIFFEIRHAMNDGDPFAARSSLVEMGLFAVSSLGFSIVLTRWNAAGASPVFRIGSWAAGAVSLAIMAAGLAVAYNPLLRPQPVEGGLVLNGLLLGYAMPACMALALAIVARVQPYWYVLSAKVAAIALTFVYVTLQTRRLFHDDVIVMWRRTTQAEWYAYSAVWLGLGIVLLVWGIVRGSREARLASAAFVSASVLKVFLFDLSGLEGALRAVSFIGLGAVLIGIGLMYQKLVFRPPAQPGA